MSEQSKVNQDCFTSGVVEGFYGKPWTEDQRKDLFKKLEKWGMNCYLYAPKDDYKHRAYWRELYSQEETRELSSLITNAQKHNILFYYAIAPGLDMIYSDSKELATLKSKLDQIKSLGCTAFAILFDDVEKEMHDLDNEKFESFAEAQVSVTNAIYDYLGKPKFMFCPTEYCSTRAVPNIQESEYLNTIGTKLDVAIDILWTGPLVISKTITCSHIKEVGSALKRPPVIWENLHANDYDRARLYLGPFSQRSPALIPYLRGYLTNPNCEYGPNFVAIHTLSQWVKSYENKTDDKNGVNEDSDCSYEPRTALLNALKEWLPEFSISIDAFGKEKPATNGKSLMNEDAKSLDKEELKLEELELFVDFFYLPFEYGPQALPFLQEFRWLKENALCVIQSTLQPEENNDLFKSEVEEWHKKADEFAEMKSSVKDMVEKLKNIRNRSLVYDIYSYASNVLGIVAILNSYIEWIKNAKYLKEPFTSEYRQMDLYLNRGGLPAELHKILTDAMKEFSYLEALNTVEYLPFPTPPGQSFLIRPHKKSDSQKLGHFILKTSNPTGKEKSHLIYNTKINLKTFLEKQMEDKTLMVVEDENEEIQGFCLFLAKAAVIPESFQDVLGGDEDPQISKDRTSGSLLPSSWVLNTYPSFLMMILHPMIKPSIPVRFLSYATDVLCEQGSTGMYSSIKNDDANMFQLYSSLGFKQSEEIQGYKFMTKSV